MLAFLTGAPPNGDWLDALRFDAVFEHPAADRLLFFLFVADCPLAD